MTKMLVAKVKMNDGTIHTVRTYANENLSPKRALREAIPLDAQIVSYEWLDTLSENREKWNADNPESPIPMNL